MTRVIARIRQVDGNVRIVLAQDARASRVAREIVRDDPSMIDHLHRIDGIVISAQDVRS